jgi:hypothetical protein
MTFGSNILTGALLTLASVPGWTGTEQPAPVAKEQPRPVHFWQDKDAGRLLSDYQGEIK